MHEVGTNDGGAAGNTLEAVDQHGAAVGNSGINEGVALSEVTLNFIGWHIDHVELLILEILWEVPF